MYVIHLLSLGTLRTRSIQYSEYSSIYTTTGSRMKDVRLVEPLRRCPRFKIRQIGIWNAPKIPGSILTGTCNRYLVLVPRTVYPLRE